MLVKLALLELEGKVGVKENIIKLRKLTGVTQEELGRIAKVSRSAVSLWEIGESEPRMGAVQLMADYFRIRKANIIEDGGMDNMSVSTNGVLFEVRDDDVLSDDEREVVEIMRSLDKDDYRVFMKVARSLGGINILES